MHVCVCVCVHIPISVCVIDVLTDMSKVIE